MKYIDAEKLIERLEEMKRAEYENCGGVNSKTGALQEVQELIDSLQQEQPEVDSLIRSELPDMEDEKSLGLCYCNQFGNHRMTSKDVREIARHFYELGQQAGAKETDRT